MKYGQLVLIVALLVSCAPRGINQEGVFGDHSPQVMIRETTLTVSMTPELVSNYDAICLWLHDQAWSQGTEELLHLFVSSEPLVRPVQGAGSMVSEVAGEKPLLCDPWQDQVTGTVSQTALMKASLIPERRFAGVILALQDNQTMGGMLSSAYVSLMEPATAPMPIPVLIVQQSSGLEQGMMQVVGSGLITQLTDSMADSMGQMLILESTREILPGDHFFQLQVQAVTVPMSDSSLPLGLGDEDELVETEIVVPVVEDAQPILK